MITADVLEKPGSWRSKVIVLVFTLTIAPILPLFSTILTESGSLIPSSLGSGFGLAIFHSFTVGIAVAVISIFLGVPCGVLAGLYNFFARNIFLSLIALPLLVPSFLWAIGLSQLRIHLGFPTESILSGWSGTVFAFSPSAIALVFYATLLSTRQLSKSQVEAVKLVGGELLIFYYAFRAALPLGALTGALAGVLTLSDPGPGQILGFAGVPYEILTSFSALYDFNLAAKQCLTLTAAVFIVATPLSISIAPHLVESMMGRSLQTMSLAKNKIAGPLTFLVLLLFFLTLILPPIIGLLDPLLKSFPADKVYQELQRTMGPTFSYAIIAGVIATFLGFCLAIAIGREKKLRRYGVIGLFIVLSLPPTMNALGFLQLGSLAPQWLDPVFRSQLTVGIALALRYVPITAVLAIRTWGTISPSMALAASLHGVSALQYFAKILLPIFFPSIILSIMIVGILATAEVGTVLLLRPPGADSLPVQIYTIMANAPESLVSGLCFLYIAGASFLMILGWLFISKEPFNENRI